jgi:hypothetical protein
VAALRAGNLQLANIGRGVVVISIQLFGHRPPLFKEKLGLLEGVDEKLSGIRTFADAIYSAIHKGPEG